MNTISTRWPSSSASSHLRVPSGGRCAGDSACALPRTPRDARAGPADRSSPRSRRGDAATSSPEWRGRASHRARRRSPSGSPRQAEQIHRRSIAVSVVCSASATISSAWTSVRRRSTRSRARRIPSRRSRARRWRRSTRRSRRGSCPRLLPRVRGAHQLAVHGNGVLAFEHLDHDRTGGHELEKRVEERFAVVLGVEAGRVVAREAASWRQRSGRPRSGHRCRRSRSSRPRRA